MLDPTFSILHLPAPLEEAGFTYGRACAHLLEPPRLAAYLQALSTITSTHASDVSQNPIFNGPRQIKTVIMLIHKATTINRNCLLIPANEAETATIIISQNKRLIRYWRVSIDASTSRRTTMLTEPPLTRSLKFETDRRGLRSNILFVD